MMFPETYKGLKIKWETYKGLKIKYAVGGVAVFDGKETVYVNEELKKYPVLLGKILNHELEHLEDVKNETGIAGAVKNVFKTELKDLEDKDKHIELFTFGLRHPRAFLPYMLYEDRKIIIFNQLVILLWALIFFGFVFFVGAMIIIS